MKQYPLEKIRNLCLVGSGNSGKTSLAEALLYGMGVSNRLGKIEDGNTICDFLPEEIERKISISLSYAFGEFKDYKINILDTPGFADFIGELSSTLVVSETAVLVVDAATPVDVSCENIWQEITKYKCGKAIFLNKMEKENADFAQRISELEKQLEISVVPCQLPHGQGEKFAGLTDLLAEKTYNFSNPSISEEKLDETGEDVQKHLDKLSETIASFDDKLIEEYLNGQKLTKEEINHGIKLGIKEGKIVPLFIGSATKNLGPSMFLDNIVNYFPEPQKSEKKELSALVYKTMIEPHTGKLSLIKIFSGEIFGGADIFNVTKKAKERVAQLCVLQGKKRIEVTHLSAGDLGAVIKLKETLTNDLLSNEKEITDITHIQFPETALDMAIYAKSKGEEEKMANALSSITHQEPTIKFQYHAEIKEMIVSGLGLLQLEIMVNQIKSRFGVEVELRKPRIPYKETIKSISQAQGKYKRQSGGRGQYGDCWLKLEPLGSGKGFEFVNKIVGGAIPRNYIPSIEKGVREAMDEGVLAGYSVIDIRVTVYDGSYHDVDSSDMAFKIAGAMALRKGVEQSKPTILEPYMQVEIIVTEAALGTVMGDLNSRRGRVIGMERAGRRQVIKANIPLGEMHSYVADLRSMTKGGGKFKMSFSHYEEAPSNIINNLVSVHQKNKTEE